VSKFHRLFRRKYCYSSNKAKKIKDDCPYTRYSLAICIIVILIFGVYLFQVNGITKTGYKLRELEDRAGELKLVNEKLEIKTAKLQAISKIKKEAEALGLVEVDNIKYIGNNDVAIASVK